jgi:DNA (cytosine-5)-methyltransferase 1
MAKQLLLRNVPDNIHSWIEHEREQNQMSQREFLLTLLNRVFENDQAQRLPLFAAIPSPELSHPDYSIPFKFVDLFAGIGGFRIALERLGGQCVFSSEWDRYAKKTYKAWFGDIAKGDIRKLPLDDIEDHDILVAGFPCQPFSIAGVSKKKSLGQAHGFKCKKQGNLFFHLADIIKKKKSPVLLLENVKNLQSHDKKRTWQVIYNTLDKDYRVFPKVIDAAAWVPQHRERIYMVCFRRELFGDNPPFRFPDPPVAERPKMRDILEVNPDKKYTLSDHLWDYLQKYAEHHRAKGNGFGYGIADPDGVSRTLSARYYKDGSEILIAQNGYNPRRLTPTECARLMGFDPNKYKIVVSDTQAYRQFGNAVVPKVVEAIGREIIRTMAWKVLRDGCLLKRAGAAV